MLCSYVVVILKLPCANDDMFLRHPSKREIVMIDVLNKYNKIIYQSSHHIEDR